MLKTTNILLSIVIFFLYSCTATRVNSKAIDPPTKSFVKIFHTINIVSCEDKHKDECPTGLHTSTGSGMSIDLFKNFITVITAGHVCDVRPTKKIKDSIQTITVLDHKKQMHQAWPMAINHDDQDGKTDICILWVPTLNVKKIKFSIISPKLGEELYFIGAPMGIYHPPTVPIIRGTFSGDVNKSSSMVTIPATGGSSGGAVLNKNNRIVGIIFASNIGFHHVTLMTNHRAFRKFLLQVKKDYE
jgi:hypothetical protein